MSDRMTSAATVERHGHAWNAQHCSTCGATLVGCHGCCELRCLTCNPYTDYERLNRCCTVVSSGAGTPGGEQRRGHDEAVGAVTPAARSRTPSAATTLERLRRMTPEQLDAARICRGCWEHYGVCVCDERRVRAKPVCPNCHGTGVTRFGVCTYCNGTGK